MAGDVTHTYVSAGTFLISIDLVDEDATHVSAGTVTVLVTDIALVRSVYMDSTGLSGLPGDTVTLPVMIDNAQVVTSAEFVIGYDPGALIVQDVRVGAVFAGFSLSVDLTIPGTITVMMNGSSLLPAGLASILEIDFEIRGLTGTDLSTDVDMQSASLNNGAISLLNDPVLGADLTDGSIFIERPSGNAGRIYDMLARLYNSFPDLADLWDRIGRRSR